MTNFLGVSTISFPDRVNQEYNMFNGLVTQIDSLKFVKLQWCKKKQKSQPGLELMTSHDMTPPLTDSMNHCTMSPCSDTHLGSSHGPHSVRVTHQASSRILTQNVRTTSGRGLNFSQNLSGPASGFTTYNRGSC